MYIRKDVIYFAVENHGEKQAIFKKNGKIVGVIEPKTAYIEDLEKVKENATAGCNIQIIGKDVNVITVSKLK